MTAKNKYKKMEPYVMILPGLIVFLIFFVIPVLTTFLYGFTNYDGFQKNLTFVGLKNYVNIFTKDKEFWRSIQNNVVLTVCYNTVGLTVSLALAIILNNIRGKNFYRACFFIPVIISTVAVGYTWKFMFDPANGVLSSIAKIFNMPVVDFLGNYKIALFSVIFVDIWKGQGNNMIILLAGLQSIPDDVYESAAIDGAGKWQKIRYITLPLLKPTISIVVLLTMIGCIKAFDLTYVMTKGGPFNSTELMTTRIFNEAFGGSAHYYGYASAEATILFVLILAVSLIQIKVTGKEKN